jgi:hypothetical protein
MEGRNREEIEDKLWEGAWIQTLNIIEFYFLRQRSYMFPQNVFLF